MRISLILLLCFALYLQSCGLFKNQTRIEKASAETLSAGIEKSWGKSLAHFQSENGLMLTADSGRNLQLVKLYPKGDFKYSAEGFSGAADSLIVTAQDHYFRSGISAVSKQEAIKKSEEQLERKMMQQKKSNEELQSDSKTSWKMMLMTGILFLFVGFLIYRFLIK